MQTEYGNILTVVITLKRYIYFYLKSEINRNHFDKLNYFPYFTNCPFISTCCNITSIPTALSMMADGGDRSGGRGNEK
jgi:hypothetical protein